MAGLRNQELCQSRQVWQTVIRRGIGRYYTSLAVGWQVRAATALELQQPDVDCGLGTGIQLQ